MLIIRVLIIRGGVECICECAFGVCGERVVGEEAPGCWGRSARSERRRRRVRNWVLRMRTYRRFIFIVFRYL